MSNDCIISTKDVFLAKVSYEKIRVSLLPKEVRKTLNNTTYHIVVLSPDRSCFYDVQTNELKGGEFLDASVESEYIALTDFNSDLNKEVKKCLPKVWVELVNKIDDKTSNNHTTLADLICMQDDINFSINKQRIQKCDEELKHYAIPTKTAEEVLFK